jgi:hypothetical protein
MLLIRRIAREAWISKPTLNRLGVYKNSETTLPRSTRLILFEQPTVPITLKPRIRRLDQSIN